MRPIWKVIKNKKGEEYSIKIIFDSSGHLTDSSSCTCKYWSFYGHSKKNADGKKLCRHIIQAYGEITKQSYEKSRQTLIKQGVLNKEHIKKI